METKFEGITEQQAIENRKKYGNNSITKQKHDTFISLFIESFSDPMIKILLIALAIKTEVEKHLKDYKKNHQK